MATKGKNPLSEQQIKDLRDSKFVIEEVRRNIEDAEEAGLDQTTAKANLKDMEAKLALLRKKYAE